MKKVREIVKARRKFDRLHSSAVRPIPVLNDLIKEMGKVIIDFLLSFAHSSVHLSLVDTT